MADTAIFEQPTGLHCEFCQKDGKWNQSAAGFCEECVTFFCSTCLKYHEKFHPNHVKQVQENLPMDLYSEKCPKHPEEMIKFFCQSCETTACATCKVSNHNQCDKIFHLQKLIKEFEKEKELSYVENNLELAADVTVEVEGIILCCKNEIDQYKSEAKTSLQDDRNGMNSRFDHTEQEIEKIEASDLSKVDIEEEKLGVIKTDIHKLKLDIKKSLDSLSDSKLFLTTKRAKIQSEKVLEDTDNLQQKVTEIELCKYKYKPMRQNLWAGKSGTLTVILEKGTEKGTTEKGTDKGTENSISWSDALLILPIILSIIMLMVHVHTNYTKPKVQELDEIQLSHSPHQISSFTKYSLLFTFSQQGSVHLTNLQQKTYSRTLWGEYAYLQTNVMTLERTYASVVEVSDNEVAFLSFNGQLEFYKPLEDSVPPIISFGLFGKNMFAQSFRKVELRLWNKQRSIQGFESGQHTVYQNNILYVLISKEKTVYCYDINGILLSETDLKQSFEFVNPFNIAISKNNSILYITDIDSVIGVNMKGEVIAIFRHTDLYRPKGMTTDNDGNLYVCGSHSNNIFKIKPDLSTGYELIGKDEGLHHPYSISYNEEQHTLYVGSITKNTIKVFRLTYQICKVCSYFVFLLTGSVTEFLIPDNPYSKFS